MLMKVDGKALQNSHMSCQRVSPTCLLVLACMCARERARTLTLRTFYLTSASLLWECNDLRWPTDFYSSQKSSASKPQESSILPFLDFTNPSFFPLCVGEINNNHDLINLQSKFETKNLPTWIFHSHFLIIAWKHKATEQLIYKITQPLQCSNQLLKAFTWL